MGTGGFAAAGKGRITELGKPIRSALVVEYREYRRHEGAAALSRNGPALSDGVAEQA